MNEEQAKSSLRWIIQTFGGAIAGWFAAKGWFTVDDVLSVINGGTFIPTIVAVGAGIWGLFVHRKSNAVAVVDAMPEISGVVTKPTIGGRALAEAVPSPTVATAGTPAASAIANK